MEMMYRAAAFISQKLVSLEYWLMQIPSLYPKEIELMDWTSEEAFRTPKKISTMLSLLFDKKYLSLVFVLIKRLVNDFKAPRILMILRNQGNNAST